MIILFLRQPVMNVRMCTDRKETNNYREQLAGGLFQLTLFSFFHVSFAFRSVIVFWTYIFMFLLTRSLLLHRTTAYMQGPSN